MLRINKLVKIFMRFKSVNFFPKLITLNLFVLLHLLLCYRIYFLVVCPIYRKITEMNHQNYYDSKTLFLHLNLT